jgi:hypothetical protein
VSRRRHLIITASGFSTEYEEKDDRAKIVKAVPDEVVKEATTGWQERYTIVVLCFLAFLLCNMDRVNMSIAIISMKDEFMWDTTTMGVVQSSFFWGYLLTQVSYKELGNILPAMGLEPSISISDSHLSQLQMPIL